MNPAETAAADDDDDDLWDAFGSDSSSDHEEEHYGSSESITHQRQRQQVVVAQFLTQHWLQQNSRVPKSERVVGIVMLTAGCSALQTQEPQQQLPKDNAWVKALSDKGMTVRLILHSPQQQQQQQQQQQDNDGEKKHDEQPSFQYDAVLWLEPSSSQSSSSSPATNSKHDDDDDEATALTKEGAKMVERACRLVVPGGCLIVSRKHYYQHCLPAATATTTSTTAPSSSSSSHFALDGNIWKLSNEPVSVHQSDSDHDSLVMTERRTCPIQLGTCRWLPNKSSHHHPSSSSSTTLNSSEYHHLEQATPVISLTERGHFLNETTKRRAVQALQKHGYCILGGLLTSPPHDCGCRMGAAVLEDVHAAARILLSQQHPVDLYQPWHTSSSSSAHHDEPAVYRELSMREDFRMDLRDGPALRRMRQKECGENAAANQSRTLTAQDHSTPEFLRGHPDVLEICRRVMNPVVNDKQQQQLAVGNMGRYNFGGSGPDGSFQDLRVGPVGGIVSLPGAADQALHADTPHLFEHLECLPAHYINAFTPGCPSHDGVGQTAFVHGSHRLDVTARYNQSEMAAAAGAGDMDDTKASAKEELWKLLVRPQLEPGDVLLFDCRILHFGMANESKDIERPLLYCNMTMHWFHDPKNWDNERPIFEDE